MLDISKSRGAGKNPDVGCIFLLKTCQKHSNFVLAVFNGKNNDFLGVLFNLMN